MTEKAEKNETGVTEQDAQKAVQMTRNLMSSLVERIFDSQQKLGMWESDDESPESEDYGEFLLHAHSRISSAFQALLSGGSIESADGETVDVSYILIDAAVHLLGAARRYDQKAASRFIDMVIQQAREAAEVEKVSNEVEADLGEFEAEKIPTEVK